MSPYKHEAIFGDLNKQTIKEVFESKQYKDIYDQVVGNIETSKDFICNRCESPGG